ncbi:hypothetical protein B0T26DRAFT_716747 [Lasiosphaeria miniovina]|uniref:Uncharacterized protein n=1 Tax=Lasiosphaeria miniovina TaxID=1954250 RepID=A0AA40AC91_9PEZI|nr:uncharacterized protein B0T26DRAFT_716747 [Lasiosphaeria miniovina]KAK0713198.1 hypothetical protein B0T26DRAFT_716747 [Lasiosphaeria miniovina]
MSGLGDGATQLLAHLEASAILLIEWETSLQIRLGYPLAPNGSRFFLVPDGQLQKVQDIAAELGFSPVHEDILRSIYTCELSGLAVRYLIDDATSDQGPPRRRLVFLPMSWAGITLDEAIPIQVDDGLQPALPPSTRTVPLPAACAAFARIAAREKRTSRVHRGILEQLSSVIGESLFDMSYEGDYMEILANDQPLSEGENLEIEQAVKVIKSWPFREDEEWIKDILVDIYTSKKTFLDFPWERRVNL